MSNNVQELESKLWRSN